MDSQRIDKWLWAARFYKTRSLAVDEIGKGRVEVNGQVVKPAREIRTGDLVCLRQGPVTTTVQVLGLSLQRGPAPVARQLYSETPDSLAAREAAAVQPEGKLIVADREDDRFRGTVGRPTGRPENATGRAEESESGTVECAGEDHERRVEGERRVPQVGEEKRSRRCTGRRRG